MLNPERPAKLENVIQEESPEPDSGTPGFCLKTRPERNQSDGIDMPYCDTFRRVCRGDRTELRRDHAQLVSSRSQRRRLDAAPFPIFVLGNWN